jgi:hypothetical protein
MKTTTTPRTFRGLTAIALAAFAFFQPAAHAAPITVLNPSFETGNFTSWSGAPGNWGVTSGTFDNLSPTDGTFLFYANGGPSTISQTLSDTLQPNTTYTLSVDVGRRTGFTQEAYTISLSAGAALIASTSGAQNSLPAGWTTVTATYTSPGSVTAGQALKIQITGNGPQTMFDNVRLDATAIPPSDAGTSTVTASPTTVASDNVTASTVTVTLKDASNKPAPGKLVSLAKTGGTGTGTPVITTLVGTSDSSGVATFAVTCDTAGEYVFTATDTTYSPNVVVTQTASVMFSASAVSVLYSTVGAWPPSVLADGIATSTITVTLKDATDSVVIGKTVSLAKTSGPGSPVIALASAGSNVTDTSGMATFTVKSATVGTCVFTATDDTDSLAITDTATVDFTPMGVVEDANSTVEASPAIVPADGTTASASTITVTLKDATNNPVPDKTVTLAKASGPGSPVIDPATATTNDSGIATFAVTSTTAGACVFTATVGIVTLTQTADVTFGPSPTTSTVEASPATVTADGTNSTITVTLLDADLNPVAGKDVSLASSRGTPPDTISPTSGVSDVSGVVTFTVSSTTAGSPVFTATDTTDGITIGTAGVTFVAGPVVAGNSTVIASPTTVVADDVATSTITVTLNDANNNPVAGKDVSLASSSGTPPDTISPPTSGVSNDSGVVTFTVSSSTPGTSVFTATETTDDPHVVISSPSTATVTFTAVPATITWGSATDVTLPPGTSGKLWNDDNSAPLPIGFVDTDVMTNGAFVAAVTNGNAGTVNGVTFTRWDSYNTAGTYLITYGESPITMQWAGNRGDPDWGSPNNAYGAFGYDNGTSTNLLLTGGGDGLSPGTITLSSLVAGHSYQVQIWAPTWNNTKSTTVGGVALRIAEPMWYENGPPYGLPQYVVGTFTANGTSQTISWSDIAPSAISLRDLSGGTVPDYTTWLGEYTFAEGADTTPTGDPDGDSLNNQQEYAFGLNPTSGSSVNPITQQLDKATGTFKYTRRATPTTTGLTYSYESSTTLSNPWDVLTPDGTPSSNNATPVEEITVTVPAALINANPKLFLRVKAE